MIADSLALSTFDLASACFGALRRQAGGSQANDSGLPEAGNGRSLGLNRLPFGGCRLNEITPETASKLAPVWAMSTGGQFGGLEGTPLFRDGILYLSADYARTFAVDAKSGNILWRFEPEYGDGFNAMLAAAPSIAAWRSPATS